MTLREFREKTKDLDENLVLMSLYDEYGNYGFITTAGLRQFISSKTDDDFKVCEDINTEVNEDFIADYDVKLEDLETTRVLLLS
jgi:hypothetical protein